MTNLEIQKYYDLYSSETILAALKNNYYFVSLDAKTIPTNGSSTFKSSNLKSDIFIKIEKVIIHKNNRLTLKTENFGFLQFFN